MRRSLQFVFYTTLSLALFLLPAKRAEALVDIGGGYYCQESYVMGQFQGLVNCEQYAGQTDLPVLLPGEDIWEYGGSGGGYTGENSYPDLEISTQLKCAIDKYLHDNVKLLAAEP